MCGIVCGNTLKLWYRIALWPTHIKLNKKGTVTRAVTRVVTCLSYGNALHYGLSTFVEFGNVW